MSPSIFAQIHDRGLSKKERARKIAREGEYERGREKRWSIRRRKDGEVDATVSLPPDAGSQ